MSKVSDEIVIIPQQPNDAVQTEVRMVPFSALSVDREHYSFREKKDFEPEGLEELANDIARLRINTPFLVVFAGENRWLVLDGHRRYAAIRQNIAAGITGFSEEFLVPVHILPGDVSEREKLARAVSANVLRREWSAEGRIRAAVRLHRVGMKKAEIATLLGVSEMTIKRDIDLGINAKMFGLVRRGYIGATNAAKLLAVAGDRVDELIDVVTEFGDRTAAIVKQENGERHRRGEKLLSKAEQLPRRRLTAKQVKAWENALLTEGALGEPEFSYYAGLFEEDGKGKRLKINPINARLDELEPAALAMVVKALTETLAGIAPAFKQKTPGTSDSRVVSNASEASSDGILRYLDIDEEIEALVSDESPEDDAITSIPGDEDVEYDEDAIPPDDESARLADEEPVDEEAPQEKRKPAKGQRRPR